MPIKLYSGANGSKNYRIRGSHFGVRIDQSSGTSDYTAARKVLKRIREEIERDAFNPKKVGPTFAAAVELYIKETKNTRFIEPLLERFATKQLGEITQQDIMLASHELYPNHSNATRNRQVFTPMLAILRLNGVALAIRRPDNASGVPRTFFFTPEQAARLINSAYDVDHEFGIFLTFLLYTGARRGEALKLTTDHLNLSEAWALFPKTKNGKPRMAYLTPSLVSALAGHPRGLEREGRVFRFERGRHLSKMMARAEEASGVKIPAGVEFHAFRHTWGAWMRRYGGLDTSGLIATGAWASRSSASVYEHADQNDAVRRADRLPLVRVGIK